MNSTMRKDPRDCIYAAILREYNRDGPMERKQPFIDALERSLHVELLRYMSPFWCGGVKHDQL